MGDEIVKGSKVVVNATGSTEAGTVGIVAAIRGGWALREAVIVVPGWQPREFTVPVADLSLA